MSKEYWWNKPKVKKKDLLKLPNGLTTKAAKLEKELRIESEHALFVAKCIYEKAKELYPMEDWAKTDTIPNFRYHDLQHERRLAYNLGAKQALKDMIDRAEELQLPYIRMYKKIADELGELKERSK